ncbi:MAG: type II toxin-antitoxin system HicB family antitoxin [Planctomycetes bacterium]|nr:type II toxin-antitoxin system HicB family antitoxin [Planctomycetota bacterium]
MSANVMKYKGYSATIEYSEDDGVLVGRVLGIQDIIDFHGESVGETRQEFHIAIDEYLKACGKLGKKPEKPCTGKVLLRMPPEVYAGLARVAETTGQSANQLIVDAVRVRYLGGEPDPNPPKQRRKGRHMGAVGAS